MVEHWAGQKQHWGSRMTDDVLLTERTGGTCHSVLDLRIVFAPKRLAHPGKEKGRCMSVQWSMESISPPSTQHGHTLPYGQTYLMVVLVPVILNFLSTSE